MANETLYVLSPYLSRLIPLLACFTLWFLITPRGQTTLRLMILIFSFICMRDLMTPCGLWAIGVDQPLKFHANPWVLASLGIASIGLIALLAHLLPECWRLVVGFKGRRTTGMAAGIAAGCLIGLPIRLHLGLEVAPAPWLMGFAMLAFAGNALEEVLFRGMLQGLLERDTTQQRAALGSALAFSACHGYLAFVLTDIGWPILAFTLVEGLICAQVRLRFGTWPATAAHGTAIFLIGAPLA